MRNGFFLTFVVLAATAGLASAQRGPWNPSGGWGYPGYPPSYGYSPAYGGYAMPAAPGYNPYAQPVAGRQAAVLPYGAATGYGGYPQAAYGVSPQPGYGAYPQPGQGGYPQAAYGSYPQPGYGTYVQSGYGFPARTVVPIVSTANAPARAAATDSPAALPSMPLSDNSFGQKSAATDSPAASPPKLTPPEAPSPITSEVATSPTAPATGGLAPPAAPVLDGAAQTAPAPGVLDDNGRSAGAGAGGCGPFGRVWVIAEPIYWWVKGSNLPPLVTTGPANSTQVPPPGALGANGTSSLFGGNTNGTLGGLFLAGAWLNDCQTVGVMAGYFFLGSPSNNLTAGSSGAPGSPVLARPFQDVSTGMPNSELAAFPGLLAGTVSVQSTTALQGAQANLLCNLCCSCPNACCDSWKQARGYRLDLIAGGLYMNLRDGLGVAENSQISPTSPVFPGDNIRVSDQFSTSNQFYGGQLGLMGMAWRNRFFAFAWGTLGLGDTHQTASIIGSTTIAPPGGPAVVQPGGLLALPSNIGNYSRDQLSFIPMINANIGYQVTRHVGVFVGYTFLYSSNFVRPAEVIDLGVNSTRVPTSLLPPTGPARPQFTFQSSDFWAQGINLGLWLRF